MNTHNPWIPTDLLPANRGAMSMWLLRTPENMPPIKDVPIAINAKINPTSQCKKFTDTRHTAGNADAETNLNLIIHTQFWRWLNKYITTLKFDKKGCNML